MAVSDAQIGMDDVMTASYIGEAAALIITFLDTRSLRKHKMPLPSGVTTVLAPALCILGSMAIYVPTAWLMGPFDPGVFAKAFNQGMTAYGQSQGHYNISKQKEKAEDKADAAAAPQPPPQPPQVSETATTLPMFPNPDAVSAVLPRPANGGGAGAGGAD